jgi:TRAP-type C4-dicarboxylate transport system permease small subunit
MRWLLSAGLKISRFLYVISGVGLVVMMLLTVLDVALRMVGRPITGAYELVGYLGVVVVGFALPLTTWTRGHVFMEFVIEKIGEQNRQIANVFTRIIGIALFAVAVYSLADIGIDLYNTGEGSPTLQLPVYPFAWAAALCCSVMCLVLFCDILRIYGGEYDK